MNLWSHRFSQNTNKKLSEFLPCVVRAEILSFFCSYFGRNDDFINSFWNCLTFTMYRKSNHKFVLPNNTWKNTNIVEYSTLQNCRNFHYCPVQTQKGTRFIWVFIALGIYNFELCVKNQQMDRACQKLNPKIESKGGRVTKNKPEFDFDFRMWVHLAGVVETL